MVFVTSGQYISIILVPFAIHDVISRIEDGMVLVWYTSSICIILDNVIVEIRHYHHK